MKFLKVAALLALASLPLLLIKGKKTVAAKSVETDEIFESELSTD